MEGRRLAMHHIDAHGVGTDWSYGQLADLSNRLANGLRKMGVGKGDRVAVIMPQRPEAIAASLAIWSTGAVLVPLSPHLGQDGLTLRLRDAETRIIIADATAAPELTHVMRQCTCVQQLIGLEFQNDDTLAWRTLLARETTHFEPATTLADDPAILLYTAGTTGMPKGVLHAHRVLIGILPAFVASQNWYPRPNDLFWSPIDWSTAPGLLHGLLAVMYFGRPLITTRQPAQGADALDLLRRQGITNTLLLPSDVSLMREAAAQESSTEGLSLRAMAVLGETLPTHLYDWATEHLGTEPNALYGLTEAPGLIGDSGNKWPLRRGSLGRPMPGHRIGLLDGQGQPQRPGSVGQLAVHARDAHGHPDPCLFLSYWRNDSLTQSRYLDGWFLTGDMASIDEGGYCWFVGRSDDVFRAGEYRISPLEIEDCLKLHPAVANAAVVPKPQGARGNAIKAFVVLNDDSRSAKPSELVPALQAHVRQRMAAWQIPQELEIVERLPLTSDGQVRRHVLRAREQQRSMLALARGETATD